MPLKMLTGIRNKIIEKYKEETERKKTVIKLNQIILK